MQQPPNLNSQFQPRPQWNQQPMPSPQQWNQQQPMYPRPQWKPQQPLMPPQQYQQLPQYSPQMPPPKKKARKGHFIILGVILAVLLIGGIGILALMNAKGQAAHQAVNQTSTQAAQLQTSQPTNQSTQTTISGKWTTVQTLSGTGTKKTAIFNMPNDWKINWSCSGKNVAGSTFFYVLAVAVFNANGTSNDPHAVISICATGTTKTTGASEEHHGGQVYLSIQGSSNWSIQLQELK